MGRISQLDGLRALAVGLVIVDHVMPPWFAGGGIGVSIFFVLSGYLITTLLLTEHQKTGRISLGRFYMRRVLRLYPALLAMLAVAASAGIAGIKSAIIAATYLTNLYMTVTNHWPGLLGHTWSLALEEQFYLIWPFLLPVAPRLPRHFFAVALVLLSVGSALWAQAAVSSLIDENGSIGPAVFNPLWQVHGILLGSALGLAIAHRSVPFPAMLTNAGLTLCLVIAILASATVNWHAAAVWNLLAEFAAAAAVAGLRDAAQGLGRLLTLESVLWVGVRSYAVYLWHYPLIATAFAHGFGRKGAVIAAILSVAVAGVSWRLVEGPFLKLKRRFEPFGYYR
jgi:peptidoglycan/LPS O-acetylase OafA/YrhL